MNWDLIVKTGVYIVCPVCGRVTSIDTGFCRHCRSPIGSLSIFKEPPKEFFNNGLFIGRFDSGRPFKLDPNVLQKHVAVLGMTGYGKTYLVKRLIYELHKIDVRFLIIDWDGEYSTLARRTNAIYFKPGDSLHNLKVNILDPGLDSPETHVDWLVSIFKELYLEAYEGSGISPQMEYVLRKTMLKCVRQRRTLIDLIDEIKGFNEKLPNITATKLALLTRLSRFVESGTLRNIFCNSESNFPIQKIDLKNIVVDLSIINSVSIDDARFLVNIILKHLFYRALKRPITDKLVHVTVIEEAEEVLPRKYLKKRFLDTWTPVKFALRLRKRGEDIVFISHSPDTVEEEALRNCSNIFVFRIQSPKNVKIACNLLGIDESLGFYLTSLPIGQVIARIADYPECFKIDVEEIDEEKTEYSDLSDDEKDFLESIMQYPLLSVRERMRLLGWSGRKYYLIERTLLEKGLIRCITLKLNGRGRPLKFYSIPQKMGESTLHKITVNLVKRFLECMGFKCRTGKFNEPDLIVEDKVGIEVECGRGLTISEIAKYGRKYDRVFIVVASLEAYNYYLKKFGKENFFSLEELGELVKEIQSLINSPHST